MTRLLAVLALALSGLALSLPVYAQEADQPGDSKFDSYAKYNAYVDRMLTTREWVPFIKHMGGRDEYTAEQLAKIESDFNRLYPNRFTSVALFRQTDLGGGVSQEARAYWGGGRYLFFYAILHQRNDDLVVLNFALNTKIEAIMEKF
ncbi:hypothetical protein RXV86_05935 [Alisedimentitalea sp. MJ-SS2]|uniref:hypothetical protein n=1 Tax=Aliisedimentitalea sp. MJ-SS2 TaxID=3049795 RepID=UPI00291308A4|nr:hypothetical protein [Alisedimentitalea sp. MJ-SS2]MDU8926917.1 hypothetical protein [Alisedimentitalea sp. MJ-SS2]